MSRWKTILAWTVIAIILGLALWIVPVVQAWYFPAKTNPADVPVLINENRRTLAQMIGGFLLLLALYLTFRRTTALERTVAVTEQGQITERFTRAIEQLGATDNNGKKKLEIRLGGIYALERIARDSPERDYRTIMEVLTAYVRENAPWPSKGFSKPPLWYEPTAKTHEGAENNETPDAQSPTGDIYAILDVLRRREVERVPEAHRVPLDLRRTNLYSAILHEADLYRANLSEANLQGANLSKADLREANFTETDLRGVDLRGAVLRQADFSKAVFYPIIRLIKGLGQFTENADLRDADLRKANLYQANLHGANLKGANLQGAVFFQANLTEATLEKADLQGANLYRAGLERANLTEADLRGVHLFQAHLTDANLHGANLQEANLRGANLQGANLERADVVEKQLEEAMSLEDAIMPDGSKHD